MTTVRHPVAIAVDLFEGRHTGATVPTVVGVRVPTSGYVVALPRFGRQLEIGWGFGTVIFHEIERWVADVLSHSAQNGHYVGVWSDANVTYLDVVEVLPERAVAIETALSRGEVCIFDLAAKAEIRVPEPAYV